MKTEDVKKLKPLERFWYWIGERHAIYERRKLKRPKPWTDDEILQSFFFTNPYREHDKVTVWFKRRIRDPWGMAPRVLLATVIFRWFNYIPTGEVLAKQGLLRDWKKRDALKVLGKIRDEGGQVFTGAFMINSPGGRPKLEAICDRIDNVWKDRSALIQFAEANARSSDCSLEALHSYFRGYDGLGGFMAYEIVCDLRYTYLLASAIDKETWCNPGPGAIRGIYRVLDRDFEKGNNAGSPPKPKDWVEQTQKLLALTQHRFPDFPHFEMREIEHSLCEFDKYERLLWGDGRAKRTYNGA